MRLRLSLSLGLSALISHSFAQSTPDSASPAAASPDSTCVIPRGAEVYDYIVVGSGAGGGPVAARLALAGFKVKLVDAGRDVFTVNTTVPLYSPRCNEDADVVLDYTANLYGSGTQVQNWYPRAQLLGGSSTHNALVHIMQAKHEFDGLATLLGDPSWSDDNMRNYFKKLENNLYTPQGSTAASGHGYSGWLYTDAPPTDIATDPKYYDPQLIDIITGLQSLAPPVPNADFNDVGNDGLVGGGLVTLTKNPAHNRSSVRDFLTDTIRTNPTRLQFSPSTLATKILFCGSGSSLTANGVTIASGPDLLPVARKFKGKQKLATKNIYAKYEVIISAGVYQTPQLLMLSGIGDSRQLQKFGIATRVNSPGVGQNLMDRVEVSIVYDTKTDWVLFNGCKFGDDPATDPCLNDWATSGHHGLYSAGPGLWATIHKSDPSLPYTDMWTHWAPAKFQGYLHGYPTAIAEDPHALSAIMLKARTKSKGWVTLTSNDPQDILNINKNLYATADGLKDLYAMRESLKAARSQMAATPLINNHILQEVWPGPDVKTDAQIESFIRANAWGHHACCTARMGPNSDPMAVLDGNFRVRGVKNLRVVDVSIFPEIPGFFITTPMYQASEKAADLILQTAAANQWTGTA